MMKLWSITEEDLFSTALMNTSSLFEPVVQSMGEVLIEMMRIKGTEEQDVFELTKLFDQGILFDSSLNSIEKG